MNRLSRLTALCALLLSSATVACAQTAQVDGFTVTKIPLPAYPIVPVATSISSPLNLEYLVRTSSAGASPYWGAYKEKAGFLSIQPNGKVHFNFRRPVDSIKIVWGSIGPDDTITFYSGPTVTGTIKGNDLIGVYGFGNSPHLSIASPVAFDSATLSTSGCCFEFSNLSDGQD